MVVLLCYILRVKGWNILMAAIRARARMTARRMKTSRLPDAVDMDNELGADA